MVRRRPRGGERERRCGGRGAEASKEMREGSLRRVDVSGGGEARLRRKRSRPRSPPSRWRRRGSPSPSHPAPRAPSHPSDRDRPSERRAPPDTCDGGRARGTRSARATKRARGGPAPTLRAPVCLVQLSRDRLDLRLDKVTARLPQHVVDRLLHIVAGWLRRERAPRKARCCPGKARGCSSGELGELHQGKGTRSWPRR